MALSKYGNRRDTVEAEIVKDLRKMGVAVYPTDKPFDCILGYRGVSYLGEFKDPKKKGKKNEFTPAQVAFMETWTGSAVVVLRSSQDALDWINGLEK